MWWVNVGAGFPQLAQPAGQGVFPLEVVPHDQLVVTVNGAEYAGEALIWQFLDVEANPGAVRTEAGRGVEAKLGC